MKIITISKNDSGQRLDKFLTKYLPNMPKSMLYKSLRKNCVRINGKHAKDGSVMLKEGDELKLFFKDEFYSAPKSFTPVAVDFDVVYEDENILLINKKAGTVVHADDKNTKNTLVEQMQSYLYSKGEYRPDEEMSFTPALCNRLDRNTSGIVIAAKNAAALREINEKIRNREIRKFYYCIADGIIEGSGTLEGNLTRGDKKVSLSSSQSDSSKAVKLNYRSISHKNNKTLLEIELLTGRTHQIRAQLSDFSHPLSGDTKYGSSSGGGYKLCSYKLCFDFVNDSGTVGYLNGKEFLISPDFALKF